MENDRVSVEEKTNADGTTCNMNVQSQSICHVVSFLMSQNDSSLCRNKDCNTIRPSIASAEND